MSRIDVQGNNNNIVNQNILLIGNPGVGKSTLLNSLIGKTKFKAGFSLGAGLTQALQKEEYKGCRYVDTPGLDDILIREQAAEEIREALTLGGVFKLVFVLTLEEGRFRATDLATISTILDNIKIEPSYAVVINKASEEVFKAIEDPDFGENNKMQIWCLFDSLKTKPREIIYLPENPQLKGKNNVLVDPERELLELLDNMEEVEIKSSHVSDFKIDSKVRTVKMRTQEKIFKAVQVRTERYLTTIKTTKNYVPKSARYQIGTGNKFHCRHCRFYQRSYKKKTKVVKYNAKDLCLMCYDCDDC